MRFDKVACLCALVSMPSVTVAQTSSTPLPAAPMMEPLYPSASTGRSTAPAAKPVVYVPAPVVQQAAPAPAPAAPLVQAVIAPVEAAPASVVVAPVAVAQPAAPVLAAQMLPPNTDVLVRLDEEVSSKGRKVGHIFKMTVVQDVMHAGQVVIPRGTPAQGTIAWRTGKGMFGKSAKMEITVDHLDLAGRKVPLFGRFREAGEGNTGATVGVAVAAGLVAAAFITGRSAVFAAGREFRVTTREALPLTAPEQTPIVASAQTVASK